jgi:hypothetical protein
VTTPPEALKTPAFQLDSDARIEKVRSDIAARLEKSCGNLPRAEFVALVDKMTRVQLVGERRAR